MKKLNKKLNYLDIIMPIKSRRYCKRNNKSCGTHKNKTRRYKKQMKGGIILSKEEYDIKQQNINRRIDEIFSGRKLLVAEINSDKIIIKYTPNRDLLAFNYDTYVESEGKHKCTKYDFTNQLFLKYIDKRKLKILDETI
jgi:hypothetical protein